MSKVSCQHRVYAMSEADKAYMEEQGIEKALALALAQVIREQPANGLKRIAQIISPDTFYDAEQAKAVMAEPEAAPAAEAVAAPA